MYAVSGFLSLLLSLLQELIQIPPLKVPEGWSQPKACYETNKIDVHLCAIMFWFMGGRVSTKFRLLAFVAQLRRYEMGYVALYLPT